MTMRSDARPASAKSRHQQLGVFRRFSAGLVVGVIAVAVAIAWIAIKGEAADEYKEGQLDLRRSAYLFRDLAAPALARNDAAALTRVGDLARSLDIRLTVVAEDGRVRVDSVADAGTMENYRDRPEIAAARREGFGQDERMSATTGERTVYVAVPVLRDGTLDGFVRTAATAGDISARTAGLQRRLAMGAVGLVVCAVVIGLVFTRRLEREFRGEMAVLLERDALYDELKGSQQALNTSDERFQIAMLATNDALWDWVPGTSVVWWSDGFLRLFGYESETVERTVDFRVGLIHPDDRSTVQRSIGEFLTSDRTIWMEEYRFRRADGSYAWVFDRAYVVRDAGAPRRMIGSMMDITTMKDAERMKSDFVSFVSHQLRTPLSGMNWMLELANDIPDLPAAAREYIGEARESAQRLGGLVNDLLDVSRLESGRLVLNLEPIALDVLTQSVLDEARALVHEKKHRIVIESADRAPTIQADAQLMRQVVANLVSNAIKYTPPGGTIVVGVARRNGVVRWTVKDSGIGIPKAAQARLFEKFFRADNALAMETEGTGLGLHLVRLIIEQFGGTVWCDSEERQGATFGFALPIAESA
jgi:PAS domain S-box-containing protein